MAGSGERRVRRVADESDLGFSSAAFGFGSGVFFLGYCIFEVPSNLVLHRVGARRWISRIMISWGAISTAMVFVRTPPTFYLLRFLLGAAEAGFFPGVVYYLSHWYPEGQRARAIAAFMTAVPVSGVIGGPLSGALLSLNGLFGLAGWQWLFLVEGVPAILLGVIVLVYLTDRPETADWLSSAEKDWLMSRLAAERTSRHGALPSRHLCSIDESDDLAPWDYLSLRCDWFLRLLVLGAARC